MNKYIFWIILIICISCSTNNDKLIISSTNKSAIVQFKKGLEFAGKLEIVNAESAFKSAIKLDSTFAMAYLELGLLKDDYEIRKDLIAKAMHNLESISEGERLLILGKNKFYGNQEGNSEFSYFKRLVKLYPNDDKANFLFAYINVHHGQQEPDSAIHYYKKAIKINSSVSEYYERLTEAYLLKQDFENAEKSINEHIAFLPNHENPRTSYAEMLLTNHRHEESIKAYQKVLYINPRAPWAIIGSATNLNFLSRYAEARKELDKLDTIPLSDYEYRHKWRAKTCSYLVEGKIDSAIVVLKQQKLETETGVNKREHIFHQYYPLLRMTRFYFENKQPEEGMQSYYELKNFVVSNIISESTVNRIKDLENYYLAYSHFLKNDLVNTEQILLKKEINTEDEKMLLAKILMSQEKYGEAILLIKELDSENAYYQFWLADAFMKNNQKIEYQSQIKKIKSLIEIDDLDYALVVNFLNN